MTHWTSAAFFSRLGTLGRDLKKNKITLRTKAGMHIKTKILVILLKTHSDEDPVLGVFNMLL